MTPREPDASRGTGGAGRLLGAAVFALYAAFLLAQAAFSPRWQWDVLAYVGCALEHRVEDPAELARRTYAEVREATGEEVFADLREGLPYRRAVAEDPESFRQQLGFYRGRVLYVGAMRALSFLDAPPARAAVWISALAGALAAALLFRRLAPSAGPLWAAIGAVLVGNASGLPAAAASPTPDALAAALALAGVFTLFDRGRAKLATVLFALAITARADAVFLAGAALFADALLRAAPAPGRRGRVLRAALASGALLALAFALQRLSGAPPYGVLLRHTFLGYLARPEEASGVGLVEWGSYLVRSLPQLAEPRLAALLLLTAIAWLAGRRHLGPWAAALPLAVVAALLARYAAFPALWERLLLPHAMIAGASALGALPIRPTSDPAGG